MKIGFEKEYFVTREDAFVTASPLSRDDCGYLAEARGEPHRDPLDAAYSLLLEEERLRILASTYNMYLSPLSTVRLESAFKRQCLRTYGKNPVLVEEGSMYGKFYSSSDPFSRAGLHVHFSDIETVSWTHSVLLPCSHGKEESFTKDVSRVIDIPRFVFGLDQMFASEIKNSKRLPGLYAMKDHGFEYRSLPSDVDILRVARAVSLLLDSRWTKEFVV